MRIHWLSQLPFYFLEKELLTVKLKSMIKTNWNIHEYWIWKLCTNPLKDTVLEEVIALFILLIFSRTLDWQHFLQLFLQSWQMQIFERLHWKFYFIGSSLMLIFFYLICYCCPYCYHHHHHYYCYCHGCYY